MNDRVSSSVNGQGPAGGALPPPAGPPSGPPHARSDDPTATLAGAAPGNPDRTPWADSVPDRIGPYRILREIGRGGMGSVLLAVNEADRFARTVAIKLIRRGMDTDDVLHRFALERQVLGALNHPNIARVFDAGAAPDGRPYFVMEHVDGRPITDFCDAVQYNTTQRLRLFNKVCSAVHYAHQHLIVHRDLKPGNIPVDQAGEPKLLDFGIAKILNPGLVGDPAVTGPEHRLMTPEYASPEQVKGDPISTASDVYSLGVLLYELLTGRLPYRFKSRLQDEIVRIVCEVEPEPPSTAVTRVERVELPDGATRTLTPEHVARAREAPGRADPQRLRRDLAGDVDCIVLKAMHKAPRRRYHSAEQLAEDIRRHLEGLPVIARPASFVYRAGWIILRNRWRIAGAW
jgi:serine/threonine protein kinase